MSCLANKFNLTNNTIEKKNTDEIQVQWPAKASVYVLLFSIVFVWRKQSQQWFKQ